MSDLNVLEWQNENGLTNYPFTSPFVLQDLVVDATFIQFDNYVPKLNWVHVTDSTIAFNITFDRETVTGTFTQTNWYNGARSVSFIGSVTSRYFGNLSLGPGALTAWSDFVGEKITANVLFVSSVVRSIPLKDAVYTLDSLYGDVIFGASQDIANVYTNIGGIVYQTVAGGNCVFYNMDDTDSSSFITFNAVGNHSLASSAVRPLKKINLVEPLNNNIYISGNDVIKFDSIGNQQLTIKLVGSSKTGVATSTLLSTLSV